MKKVTRRKFIRRGILAAIGLVLLDSLWFERYFIDWNFFNLAKDQDKKIKIIQISDLHLDSLRSFHRSIARKINEQDPDLILFTGDSIDNPEKLETLDEFLKLIHHSIRKFAILGNWEYWGGVDLSKLNDVYNQNNCELLVNQNSSLFIRNREISIIGVDDLVGGNADFDQAVKDLRSTDTNVVLAHCPKYRDVISREKGKLKIDLVLSGHTHGGQVNFLGFVPFKPQGSGNYLKGWYKNTEPKMYVSKGIGTSILPVRFGSRAECVVMEI